MAYDSLYSIISESVGRIVTKSLVNKNSLQREIIIVFHSYFSKNNCHDKLVLYQKSVLQIFFFMWQWFSEYVLRNSLHKTSIK